jgi:hypothetical protein
MAEQKDYSKEELKIKHRSVAESQSWIFFLFSAS